VVDPLYQYGTVEQAHARHQPAGERLLEYGLHVNRVQAHSENPEVGLQVVLHLRDVVGDHPHCKIVGADLFGGQLLHAGHQGVYSELLPVLFTQPAQILDDQDCILARVAVVQRVASLAFPRHRQLTALEVKRVELEQQRFVGDLGVALVEVLVVAHFEHLHLRVVLRLADHVQHVLEQHHI